MFSLADNEIVITLDIQRYRVLYVHLMQIFKMVFALDTHSKNLDNLIKYHIIIRFSFCKPEDKTTITREDIKVVYVLNHCIDCIY